MEERCEAPATRVLRERKGKGKGKGKEELEEILEGQTDIRVGGRPCESPSDNREKDTLWGVRSVMRATC